MAVAGKSVSEVKVELSDNTGFDDASGCNEFKGDVEDLITQDDVRIDLESGEWFLITILGNHKLRKQFDWNK